MWRHGDSPERKRGASEGVSVGGCVEHNGHCWGVPCLPVDAVPSKVGTKDRASTSAPTRLRPVLCFDRLNHSIFPRPHTQTVLSLSQSAPADSGSNDASTQTPQHRHKDSIAAVLRWKAMCCCCCCCFTAAFKRCAVFPRLPVKAICSEAVCEIALQSFCGCRLVVAVLGG